MTDPKAATIIDELITIWSLGEKNCKIPDFNIVDKGLAYIAQTRKEHPCHPITIKIITELRKRELLD